MSDNTNDKLLQQCLEVIREAHYANRLPQLLGEALGKEGVLLALIDVTGAITVVGNSKPAVPHTERNSIMIRKMAVLLKGHMQDMMKKAQREVQEPKA